MDKQTLRKVYLEKRITLNPAEYNKRNKLLCERLINFLQQQDFRKIHLFFSLQKFKEVDLTALLKWAEGQASIQLAGSVTDLQTINLNHFLIQHDTLFELNRWGIPEPVNAEPFDITQLDCVLVPMVIGSKTGERIGYGKGYYDRFLSQCSAATTFVGLNLGPLLEGNLFAKSHDIPMDYMLTPFQLLKV